MLYYNNKEDNMFMDKEGTTLATEILQELKASAKRWFIAFVVMVCIEAFTIGGFLWYISLPIDDITVENDSGNANYIGDDLNGVLNNGKSAGNKKSNKEQKNGR